MINKPMQDAMNEQINKEMFSSFLYLSMAAYFEDKNLPGFANWMRAQTKEETTHAMKIYDFIHEQDGGVVLKSIAQPPDQWQSPLAAFEAAQKHERKVTAMINDLVKLAGQQKEQATSAFLQWFVDEQVEEESSVGQVVGKLKAAQTTPDGLTPIDQELGERESK